MNFVQIGANIGNPNDKLYENIKNGTWTGLLVEPNPYAFEELQEAYNGIEGLIYDEVAITDYNGTLDLYIVREELSKGWASSSLSFMKAFGLKENDLIPITVDCITLYDLLLKHDLVDEQIDRLVIDTEGNDSNIIFSTDFTKLNITEIIFEFIHAEGNQRPGETAGKMVDYLKNQGYSFVKKTGEDIYMRKNND